MRIDDNWIITYNIMDYVWAYYAHRSIIYVGFGGNRNGKEHDRFRSL